jgi:hypothetical protein
LKRKRKRKKEKGTHVGSAGVDVFPCDAQSASA